MLAVCLELRDTMDTVSTLRPLDKCLMVMKALGRTTKGWPLSSNERHRKMIVTACWACLI